jgi:hypothetical protein
MAFLEYLGWIEEILKVDFERFQTILFNFLQLGGGELWKFKCNSEMGPIWVHFNEF